MTGDAANNPNTLSLGRAAPEHGRGNWPAVAAALVLAIAYVVLAASQIDRSIWYDEGWVVDNALAPTVSDAWAKAISQQNAIAVGYLAVEHWLTFPGADVMWTCRLQSAAYGLVAFGLAGWILGGFVNHRAAGFAAALVLLACPLFQRYAMEIKQYSAATTAVLAMLAAAQAWCANRSCRAAWVWFIAAVFGMLFSYIAWLFIAASGVIIAGRWLIARDWRQMRRAVMFGLALIALAAAIYFTYLCFIAGNEMGKTYWDRFWLPTHSLFATLKQTFVVAADRFEQAWHLYHLPAAAWSAAIVVSIVGWALWLWRQPVSALCVFVFVVLLWLGNLGHKWPSAIRINVPPIMLVHMCMLCAPLTVVWWVLRRVNRSSPRLWSQVAAPVAAVLIAAVVVAKSHNAPYEVAAVDRLYEQLEQTARDDDLVVLDMTTSVMHRLTGRTIRGDVRTALWPEEGTIVKQYLPYLQDADRRVLFPFGHYSEPMVKTWNDLGTFLRQRGRWRTLWHGPDTNAQLAVLFSYKPDVDGTTTFPEK